MAPPSGTWLYTECIQQPGKKEVSAGKKYVKGCIQRDGINPMAEQGKVITFRLSEAELLELEREAKRENVSTIQQFAKKVLIERLEGGRSPFRFGSEGRALWSFAGPVSAEAECHHSGQDVVKN